VISFLAKTTDCYQISCKKSIQHIYLCALEFRRCVLSSGEPVMCHHLVNLGPD